MSTKENFHMNPDEFRKYGKAVIDWIADYYENIESYPVLSQAKPGQIRSSLPQNPPEKGEDFETLLRDMNQFIIPGITHWQSPNFFAFFPANTSGPSILGDLLSSGLGVQGMLWQTSPACTELETLVLDWLVDMLDLPKHFKSTDTGGGVIQDSASSASLCALLTARENATDFVSNEKGIQKRLIAYTSTQTHSSIEKAIKISGIGKENLRLVSVDKDFALDPTSLSQMIKKDKDAGHTPFFVCATIGTTSSNAIDPLSEIGKICKVENLWFHVDGAMLGTAAICPEFRSIQKGLEYANSYAFNPHKWMFTNFDCDCFYVNDRKALIKTLSILPEYLKNKATDSGSVIDYRDWHIPLGRRFRSLKLWFVIRHYGIEGLRHHIKQHIELAQTFAQWIRDSTQFALVVNPPLNMVCFKHANGNDFNKKLLETLNAEGKIYLTHTILNNVYTLRFCVGQTNTEEQHVKKAWGLIQDTAIRLNYN